MISILIVSDTHIQISVRDLSVEILRKIPHPPVALSYASSAEEGIGMLSTESYTLLIADYELPGLSGLKLIQQVSD